MLSVSFRSTTAGVVCSFHSLDSLCCSCVVLVSLGRMSQKQNPSLLPVLLRTGCEWTSCQQLPLWPSPIISCALSPEDTDRTMMKEAPPPPRPPADGSQVCACVRLTPVCIAGADTHQRTCGPVVFHPQAASAQLVIWQQFHWGENADSTAAMHPTPQP